MMLPIIVFSVFAIEDIEPSSFYAGNDELRGYLLEAGENHPGLNAMYEEWLAALERIPQATALEDPMLMYQQFLYSDVYRFGASLQQKFPWFGTRRMRGEKAKDDAEAALARLYAERNRIFADVKNAYFEYAFLAESLHVVEAEIDILKYVEETAQARYSVGMTTQSDVLRTEVALVELQDRFAGLLQYRPALSARLSETLGRAPGEELPWPQEASLPPAAPSAEVVSARLKAASPELMELQHMIDSRRKDVVLAKKKGYPDFTLGFEYMGISMQRKMRPDRPPSDALMALNNQLGKEVTKIRQAFAQVAAGQPISVDPTPPTAADLIDYYSLAFAYEPMTYSDGGDDDSSITLQMNLPIYRKKIRAGINEAKHMEQAAEHDKHRKANELDAAARESLFKIQDAQRRLNTLSSALTPEAEQIYEDLQTAYASAADETTILDILNSVKDLLDFQLEQAEVRRNLQAGAAELELLMGGPWTSTEAPAEVPKDAAPAKGEATESELE